MCIRDSIQLHACNDTCKVTAIIDGSKCIVEVVQTLGMSLGSGCMAELNIGILLSSCLLYTSIQRNGERLS